MVRQELQVRQGLTVLLVLAEHQEQQVLAEHQEQMVPEVQVEQRVQEEHQVQVQLQELRVQEERVELQVQVVHQGLVVLQELQVQVVHQGLVVLQELAEFKEMMLPIQVDGSILILVLGAIQEVKILIPIIHRWPYQQDLVYIVMISTQHYMNNGGKPVRHYLMLDIYFIYK